MMGALMNPRVLHPDGCVTYQRETARAVRAEIEPLLRLHFDEIGQQDLTLDPDWERIEKLCADGMLFVLTARATGRLIGYNAFILCRHLHYRETVAQNDVIYVHPNYRNGNGSVGRKLVRHAETALAALGIAKVFYHAKPSNRLGELLERLGYPLLETIHGKRLEGGA